MQTAEDPVVTTAPLLEITEAPVVATVVVAAPVERVPGVWEADDVGVAVGVLEHVRVGQSVLETKRYSFYCVRNQREVIYPTENINISLIVFTKRINAG